MRRTLLSAWLCIVGVDNGWLVRLWVYVSYPLPDTGFRQSANF